MDKTWIEVEIDESLSLLRKKLEMTNDMSAEDMDHDDIRELREIYETMNIIWCMKQSMKEAKKA